MCATEQSVGEWLAGVACQFAHCKHDPCTGGVPTRAGEVEERVEHEDSHPPDDKL